MAIGTLAPATWLNGTVLTTSYLQTLQNDINGNIAGTGPTFRSLEIDGTGGATSTVGAGSIKCSASLISGGRLIQNTNVGLFPSAAHSAGCGFYLNGTAPTMAAGTGAGTTPGFFISGNDAIGQISLTVGASPAANSTIATITFAAPYENSAAIGAVPILTPANVTALGATNLVYASGNGLTTSWTIKCGAGTLTAAATYVWNYMVMYMPV